MSFQCMRHSEFGQTTQDRTFEQDGAGAASPELSVFRPPACLSFLRSSAFGSGSKDYEGRSPSRDQSYGDLNVVAARAVRARALTPI